MWACEHYCSAKVWSLFVTAKTFRDFFRIRQKKASRPTWRGGLVWCVAYADGMDERHGQNGWPMRSAWRAGASNVEGRRGGLVKTMRRPCQNDAEALPKRRGRHGRTARRATMVGAALCRAVVQRFSGWYGRWNTSATALYVTCPPAMLTPRASAGSSAHAWRQPLSARLMA